MTDMSMMLALTKHIQNHSLPDITSASSPEAPYHRWLPARQVNKLEYLGVEVTESHVSFFVLQDWAVLPGRIVSYETVGALAERKKVLSLIARLCDYGKSKDAEPADRISAQAAASACGFIKLLPFDVVLPTVSPDGEGGVMMVWETEHASLLIAVDDSYLHAVENAATSQARYHDEIPFQTDVMQIPRDILQAIPTL